MSDLTEDEYAVLMIAREGQSLMPIGRWKAPVESLHARGLLERGDAFNYFKTIRGEVALEKHEGSLQTDWTEMAVKVNNARTQARMSAEQAAHHLSLAARASAPATGDTLEAAARAWSKVVLDAALELLK